MWNRGWYVLLCFTVLCPSRPTSAITGFGMELLMTQLRILHDQLEDIEHKMKLTEGKQNEMESASEARDAIVQAKLDKLENKLNRIVPYSSCKDVPTTVSGTYAIQFGLQRAMLPVYCEQTAFGGGWIVFQHRFNGSVDFYRTWAEYRDGFGSFDGEFWLGLESLHQLTSARTHELMVEVRNFYGDYGYAHYDQFTIANEGEQYSLKLGKYDGTAGDSMVGQSNVKFTTKDRDNDLNTFVNCAVYYQGAWWYDYCSHSNLNGIYQNTTDVWSATIWYFLSNDSRAMAYSRMMIRELK